MVRQAGGDDNAVEAKSKIAIHFTKNGEEIVLDIRDCALIINALIRTRQLECHIENVQAVTDYTDCCITPGCAFPDGGSRGDEVIWLDIDGCDCHEGCPVEECEPEENHG